MPPKSKFKKLPLEGTDNKNGPVIIYWFRTDLRLHDSPALTKALSISASPAAFYPIWTWDPHYVYRARVGPNRWKFLTECKQDLSDSLKKLNPKQKLLVIREAPQTLFPKLFKAWSVTHLCFEKDTDAYGRGRDDEVMKLAKDAGVEVVVEMGRTLFDPDELVKNNGGRPTMSMSQVLKAAEKINHGQPAKPLDAPTSIPDPGPLNIEAIEAHPPSDNPDFNASIRGLGKTADTQYSKITGPNADSPFDVPTLKEMGIDPSTATTPHKGGETVALALLKSYIDNEEYVGTFEKPASAPTDVRPQSTTLLSPHHHFGSLSVRKFWWDVQDVFEKRKKEKKKNADPPMNFPGQLLFRDMYFAAQAALGWEYAQEKGNPICRFIPWHLPSSHGSSDGETMMDGSYIVDDPQAEEWFRRWREGRTGFPWIDALMRQLRQEGWIHHLGRHAVACFLTRGGCYVHWERGAEVFEEWLIDHETACNAGNWMWLSCTAFFSQFFRCYSPIAFPKKWDPEGNFVKKYVPELANFDKKYIYEPHKAPIADQKKWGCMIKGDGTQKEDVENKAVKVYPKPMFDFNDRRKFCIDKMKEAYDVGLHGNDEKVINGKWKEMFPDVSKNRFDGEKKDTMNGSVDKGTKRAREDEAEDGIEAQEDDGTHADVGDVTDGEPPKKATKKTETILKTDGSRPTRGTKGQGTLDKMVSRAKTKG